MAESFLHGVEVIELAKGVRPITATASAVCTGRDGFDVEGRPHADPRRTGVRFSAAPPSCLSGPETLRS